MNHLPIIQRRACFDCKHATGSVATQRCEVLRRYCDVLAPTDCKWWEPVSDEGRGLTLNAAITIIASAISFIGGLLW